MNNLAIQTIEDNEGLKRVNTTIWGVTEDYVILKTSTIIPMERIVSVA